MSNSPVTSSIGRRIGMIVAVAVSVAVLCVAGPLATYQAYQSALMKRSAVESTAYVFASAVADYVEEQHVGEIRTVLRSMSRIPGIISASVHGADGKPIATLGQRAILTSDIISKDPGFWDMMRSSTAPVSVNIIKNSKPVGTLVVVTDISDLRARFIRTVIAAIVASLLAATTAVALSMPLQRRITRPIANLTESMRKIRQNRDYSTQITSEGIGETAVMVESFNSLISDIRLRDETLQKLAYFDPLTGLPNRSNFTRILAERLENLLGSTDAIAVVLLNIDDFHSFNDAFGHVIGDKILVNVATTIRAELASTDVVARLGGDEFALIVDDDGTGQRAELALARIHSAFFSPLKVLDLALHLTIAAGVTILPRDGHDAGDALRHVDLAAKAAKQAGPGRTMFFRSTMDETVRNEAELGQGLRSAIGNGELVVHYQPLFHTASAKVTGFEALLRWKHPNLGYVPPAKFIPLAEKTGSIIAIGDWVLAESCRQAKAWIDAGEAHRAVSVNVSPAQILQSGYVMKVVTTLERTGLPNHLLYLEVTESLFLGRSLSSVRAVLDELHQHGIGLALDDFGTGYSSLAYLSQLPFDKLKTDRSFINSANSSTRRLEILRSIITMAHGLGLEVVAEGAETEEEIALLRHMKADEVQGFGIAKPAEAETAIRLARQIEADAAGRKTKARSA